MTPSPVGGERRTRGFGTRFVVIGAMAVAATAIVAFSVLLDDVVRSRGLASYDLHTVWALVGAREPRSMAVMRIVTAVGSPMAMSCVAAAVCGWLSWWRRTVRPLVLGAVGVGGIAVLDTATKYMVARPRPPRALRAVAVDGYSFPSGHASFSAVVIPLCCVLATHWAVRGLGRRVLLWLGALVVVASVGLSRVFLGAHYPSDVLAGWSLAAAWDVLLLMAMMVFPASPPKSAGSGEHATRG